MYKNLMFYALICINNHIIVCYQSMARVASFSGGPYTHCSAREKSATCVTCHMQIVNFHPPWCALGRMVVHKNLIEFFLFSPCKPINRHSLSVPKHK